MEIFIDVEAAGGCPTLGEMTEFGCVAMDGDEFHGLLVEAEPDPENPAVPLILPDAKRYDRQQVAREFEVWVKSKDGRPVMISDNPAYDFQWMNCFVWEELGYGLLGHSARRIGDYYAGLVGDWRKQSKWKKLRVTPHTHHPVDDAKGNFEAWNRIQMGER